MCWDAVPSCAAPSHAHCGHLGFEEEETRRLRCVFCERTDNQRVDGMKWCQDTALPTTFSEPHAKRACLFASVLSILVQPTLSMMMDGWLSTWSRSVEQQLRLETPPPRLNLTKARSAFLKSVAPHVSVGHAAMDYEINRQMLLEAQKFPGGCNGQDDGWGTMTTMLGRWAP